MATRSPVGVGVKYTFSIAECVLGCVLAAYKKTPKALRL